MQRLSARRSATRSSDRLVLLTNIPSPYRTSFYNTLAASLARQNLSFHVLYCAKSVPHRQWSFDVDAQHYPFTFLKGFDLRRVETRLLGSRRETSFRLYINPSVLSALHSLAPRWLVSGGSWHLPTALLARLSAPRSGMTRILWSEGHPTTVRHQAGLVPRLRRRVYASYDAFAAPNARSAAYALGQAGQEKPVLPLANTVDEAFYTAPPDLERLDLRATFNVHPDARLLVSICQLEDRKSVLELARAYRAVEPSLRSNSLLVFLGDGPRRAELEEIAHSVDVGDLRVLGHQPGAVVRDWLWAADAFVLPTKMDPNPLSPIEASFASLPLLLSSQAGNVDELVIDGVTGWRFSSLDESGIREGLSKLLATPPATLRRMGRAAQSNANESFRRRTVADQFIASLLNEFPASR